MHPCRAAGTSVVGSSVLGMRANSYPGSCTRCGIDVAPGAGSLTGKPGRWQTWCAGCAPSAPARGTHDGWFRTPLASLDFETTGVDPLHDRVVSYGLIGDRPVRGGEVWQDGDELVSLVNPGLPIPPGAAAVHGISDAQVAGAPSSLESVAVVLDWVDDLVARGTGLVVFNAAYDLTMLRAEADRVGLPQPDWEHLVVVDPLVLDWGVHGGDLGTRKLVDVCAYYGVEIGHAHDAACDARAARQVAFEIGARFPDVGRGTLENLMAMQRRWHAARAEDWNSYARRVGRPTDDPAGWPLGLRSAA